MRIILCILLSLIISTSAGAWTQTATFEDGAVGSVAQGTSGFTYAGSATTFSNTRASSGTKSARMVWPQCSAECGWGVCHGEIDHADVYNGSQIWLRGYYYFDPGWQFNYTHIKILTLRTHDASDNLAGNIRIVNVGPRMYYSNSVIPYANGGDSIEVDTGADLDVGVWQYIEIYLNVSTTNPIVRMWKNGVLIMQDTSHPVIVTGGRVVYSGFMNTWNAPGSPQVQTQYIDDVVVTTDQPSNQDSSGHYMIGSGEYVPPPTDTTSPVVDILTSNPSNISADSLSVSWTATDNVGVTQQKWRIGAAPNDSNGTVAASSPATTSGYASGANTLYVGAKDAAGNWGADSIVVNYSPGVDTTPPEFSGGLPSGEFSCSQNPLSVTLQISSNENATARMATSDMGYDSMTDTFTTTGGTTHSEVKQLPCNASYAYYVRGVDSSGNKSPTSTQIQFSIAAPGTSQSFFEERFEDASYAVRGWYDSSGGTIVSPGYPGSCMECNFVQGGTQCSGGSPQRHLFPASDSVYVQYYIKFDTGWTSDQTYHPTIFYVLTDQDGIYEGPGYTYQTVFVKENGGKFGIGGQDGKNIDEANIGVDLCATSESRAVHGCNGQCDGNSWNTTNCQESGGVYYNSRWALTPALISTGVWYKVEVYFKMNTVSGGVGLADGEMRLWVDGVLKIAQTNMQLRTGDHPTMKFNQFILNPYIGAGSQIAQKFWIDELTVAQFSPYAASPAAVGGATFKAFSGIWQ